MESTFCVNCGSASGSMVLDDEQIRHCIQQWCAPLVVQVHDFLCTICWTEAGQVVEDKSLVGRNCVLCKTELQTRKRSHQIIQLRTDTQLHVNIKNIILERLLPLQVQASQYICHPCWQRAERAAKHHSLPSTSRATTATHNTLRCVNCHIDLIRMRRHILEDNVIFKQVQQQIAPRVVTRSDYICHACHTLFSERDAIDPLGDSVPSVGHLKVCIKCGRSVANSRSYTVGDEINSHILHIVQTWVQPQEIQPSDLICHRCYQRAETLLTNASEPVPKHPERITLLNYLRAPDTHSRCIFPVCNSTSQQIVPYMIRVRLFSDHKYYIPRNCRICRFHLETQPWMDLFNANINHSFTAAYIEDFCDLLKSDRNTIDFQNIEAMDDRMVHYWLGYTKQQFRDLEAALPEFRNRDVALGAYLMKLRTGDSDDRIATLMNMSRSTLSKLIFKVRSYIKKSSSRKKS
ncbi:hypothetical protein evm_005142 [Chilo suppressalis]|nr:hypothetical protein evm_005142 [Chilo suppressalis]